MISVCKQSDLAWHHLLLAVLDWSYMTINHSSFCKFGEAFRNFITNIPCLPCIFFSSPTKISHNIAACKSIKYKINGLFWPYSRHHLMNWNPSNTASLAKGNPHDFKSKLLQGLHQTYGYDQHVGVIGFDDNRLATFICCIRDMHKYS